nr:MAG TPA: hypothetical protein [Caudoviricetes sp.]
MAEQSKRFGRVPGLKRVLECSYFGEVDTDFSSYQLLIEALDPRVSYPRNFCRTSPSRRAAELQPRAYRGEPGIRGTRAARD